MSTEDSNNPDTTSTFLPKHIRRVQRTQVWKERRRGFLIFLLAPKRALNFHMNLPYRKSPKEESYSLPW